MGTLRKLKNEMRKDKELRSMMVRSGLHELYIDLDGDKVADIALIDSTHDGNIDTLAIDITGDGNFNFYAGDKDGNGIIDTIEFYDDDDDMPIASYFGRAVEEKFIDLAESIYSHIIVGEIITDELIRAFADFESRAEQEFKEAKKGKDEGSAKQ